MSVMLDHLLWAVPDLDAGVAGIAALTGVTPSGGGSHPGFGTRNALLSLGPDVYLEVIAPDPAQAGPAAGALAAGIAARRAPGLMSFAVAVPSIASAAASVAAAGLATDGPVAMTRRRADGVELAWSVLFAQGPLGPVQPFFIDWHASPHPARTAPGGCRLARFVVLHPDPPAVRAQFAPQGITVEVAGASTPGFLAELITPRGTVWLTG